MNLLEPWIFARIAAGLVATALFLRAAIVGARVLRHLRLGTTTEGQLALERRAELAATSLRVGGVVSILGLLLSVAAADRLAPSLKGAMCGYGVVHAVPLGAWSIGLSIATALAAGATLRVLALDRELRRPSLFEPIAWLSIAVAALGVVDLALVSGWLGSLDFSVVASCCSSGVDEADGLAVRGAAGTGRLAIAIGALVLGAIALALGVVTARRPERRLAVASGLATALLLPIAMLAIALEIAPYVYEAPHHKCAYCLLRADAWFVGYPLFGALFAAVTLGLGGALSALVAPATEPTRPFFARSFRGESACLAVALAVGLFPIVRFAVLTGGASLFP